ncbi:hypothetical protein O3G_MSEX003195 [Manduca sexta]|uniref:Reverse transcriptase domain-containing protein n=1 Tax=Manduca sexta TaxID=7130 RepID=A0A921YRD4_MANSE|nr:hypothetical protein O3G_MSEX003195 [Manduca sexta]
MSVSTSRCLLFADDLKLYSAVSGLDDCKAIQNDINAIVAWSEANLLHFNESKCKVITFTRVRQPLTFNYTINDNRIERVDKIKDLGLLLDSRLDFRQHIISTCESASKILGFVIRVCSTFDSCRVALTLYKAYVRSRLEYNALVWDPYQSIYSLGIERIQKKFARYLYKRMYGYYPYLYPSMFITGMVGLNTLEYRRKLLLLVHYYHLLINKVDNPTTLEQVGLACIPARFLVGAESADGPRRCRRMFAAPRGVRTHRGAAAPTARAVALLNAMHAQHADLDLFHDKPRHIYNVIKLFLDSL